MQTLTIIPAPSSSAASSTFRTMGPHLAANVVQNWFSQIGAFQNMVIFWPNFPFRTWDPTWRTFLIYHETFSADMRISEHDDHFAPNFNVARTFFVGGGEGTGFPTHILLETMAWPHEKLLPLRASHL